MINRWHMEDVITMRTRDSLRQKIAILQEVLHLGWQLYGNFIFYEWRGKDEKTDVQFQTCMDQKNPGLQTSMLIFLMVGYLFLAIYVLGFCIILVWVFQMRGDIQSEEENLQKILRNLSRVKFSEGTFGQLGPENECIICMQQYGPNDMITTLSCNEKHFFHTHCIEKWISNRNQIDLSGPKCPICRSPIKVEDVVGG